MPTRGELDLLQAMRARNVRVRILTNSLNSTHQVSAHSGYRHYRRQLLEEGIELYEVRAQLGRTSHGSGQSRTVSAYGTYGLHGKLLIFDRQSLYAGSMNFDRRSRHLNTEIGVIIDSPQLASQTAARFEAMTQPASAYAVSLRSDRPGHGLANAGKRSAGRVHPRTIELAAAPPRGRRARAAADRTGVIVRAQSEFG